MIIKNFVLLLCILSCSYSGIFAQQAQRKFAPDEKKTISREKFDELKSNAEDKLRNGNYRKKSVFEIFTGANSTPDEITTEISEGSKLSDSYRFIKEIIRDGKFVSRTGSMRIGADGYSLSADGSWVRVGGSGSGRGSGMQKDERVFKFAGKSKFKGKQVLIYEVSGAHGIFFIKDFVEANENSRYIFTSDYKLQHVETTNDFLSLGMKTKTTIVNEYNAVVNIKAPETK